MTAINEAIRTFLDESDFRYNFNEDIGCFDFGLNVENGSVQVRLLAREEEDYFMAYVIWDGKIPTRALPLVTPILNEINYNTKFTTLCIDPQDGELSCHCGINTDDSTVSPKQIGVTMHVAVKALDDNIEQIMRAAWNAPANADGKYN